MLLDHRKFLAGDPIATRAFLLVARSSVRRRFHKPSQIDAVVQDTMVEMMTKLEAGDEPDPGNVAHWIAGCANNAIRRELTRIRRTTEPYDSALHKDPHTKLSEQQRHRVDLERVDEQLRELEGRVQQMFLMRLQGYSHAEIAARFESKPGATRTMLSRLRQRLADELGGAPGLNFEFRQLETKAHDDSSTTR